MTDQYAVIGNPIGHSKSPEIHLEFAAATGQDISYVAIEAPIDGFAGKVNAFRAAGGRGLNITTPFKLDAFAYATELRPRAKLAGAVNAMAFEGERLLADNFDGIGLTADIVRNLGVQIGGRHVLLLGAGGAVRGALAPILEQRPATLVLANRSPTKAQAIAQEMATYGAVNAIACDDLSSWPPFDIVINATSASQRGELPFVPASSFAPDSLAYELAYGKGLTPFLRLARSAGVMRIADGVGMLVEQAAEAFAWWRGVRPDTRPMIEALTIALI